MTREYWLLLALHHAHERGLSPVQIQKSLFLLGKELPQEVTPEFYPFVPHNYGPFSKEIYTDAEKLAERGLVAIEPQGSYSHYVITESGRDSLQQIEREFPERAYRYLRGFGSVDAATKLFGARSRNL